MSSGLWAEQLIQVFFCIFYNDFGIKSAKIFPSGSSPIERLVVVSAKLYSEQLLWISQNFQQAIFSDQCVLTSFQIVPAEIFLGFSYFALTSANAHKFHYLTPFLTVEIATWRHLEVLFFLQPCPAL